MIEIQPASLSQVITGRNGNRVTIDDDVCGVAKQLLEIDPRLRVSYIEEGEYFMVYLQGAAAHGRNHPVLTAQYLDGRVVQRVREVASGTYDPGAEGDRIDAQANANNDYQFSQSLGEASEKLRHAIKTDLSKGRPGPVYIPPDLY